MFLLYRELFAKAVLIASEISSPVPANELVLISKIADAMIVVNFFMAYTFFCEVAFVQR